MVPRTPIAVKPPSPTGASLRLTSLVTGIRSRAAFLHQAPAAVLIPNEPESERPGPEDSQPGSPPNIHGPAILKPRDSAESPILHCRRSVPPMLHSRPYRRLRAPNWTVRLSRSVKP